jgi:hypothetical protein
LRLSVEMGSKSKLRSGGGALKDTMSNDSMKAKLFLFVACLWPIWVLALFAASSPNQDLASNGGIRKTRKEVVLDAAKQMVDPVHLRNVLDRVDIMGYGPTHPRLGLVIVGGSAHSGSGEEGEDPVRMTNEEVESLVSTVESVYRNTDLNRIFLICVMIDGRKEDANLRARLEQIDAGSVPHWHGLRPDFHLVSSSTGEDPHGRKIQVLFNEQRQGLTASRQDAAEFIQLLADKHEESGLKSPLEDIILVLLQSGAQLSNRKWLALVTSALIVPPPLLGKEDSTVAMKLANAVSFQVEGVGKRTSFDEKFAPIISDATASDINLSSGMSYATPAVNGVAMALRLDTFLKLPAQDPTLMDPWPANLELSLNLWLCADGIDIIQDVEIIQPPMAAAEVASKMAPLDPELAARFATVWMEERFARRFFQAYSTTITRLEWETLVTKARESNTFPKDLTKRCRSFQWFAEHVNTDLSKVLEQVVPEEEVGIHKAVVINLPPPTFLKAESVTVPQNEMVPQVKDHAFIHMEPPPLNNQQQQQQQQQEAQEEAGSGGIPNLAMNNPKKPSKPLCEECLEIVQRAKPVDISFVDVSGGNVDFPHKGARDENGNWGYVHDESALRQNPPPFNFDGDRLKRACMRRDDDFRMLHEQVFVDLDYDKKKEQESGGKRDKIFCLVYTIESGHDKIPNIRESWA